jgi:hypothetical protein
MFSFPNAAESILVGHDGCVNALTWSSDGTTLFSGSDDCHIGMWSLNDAAFPLKRHASSGPCGPTVARHRPLLMHRTTHRSNVLDVAVPTASHSLCVSTSIGGTIDAANLECSSSTTIYDCDEDSRHTGSSARDKLGRRCEFLDGSEALCLAAIGGEIKLFDLRLPAQRVAAVVCKGSTFALGPQGIIYYAAAAGLSVADIRFCSHQHLDEQILWKHSDARPISGIDVSYDGDVIAVSCMDAPMFLLSSTAPGASKSGIASMEVVSVSKFDHHKNSETFLKRPALMYVNGQVWVGHGCDSGKAFLYEGGVDVHLAPAFHVQDANVRSAMNGLRGTPHSNFLTAFPPSGDSCRLPPSSGGAFDCRFHLHNLRSTDRRGDSRICNVVAPHPSLRCSRHFTTPSYVHPGLSIIATSGLESTIHLFSITGDDQPRMGVDFIAEFTDMTKRAASGKSSTFSGRSSPKTLQHAAILKDTATAVFGQKRYALALELYSQLGCAARLAAFWNEGVPQGEAQALVCALWGNAALAASRLGLHSVVLAHCDAIVLMDDKQPKALYRRACALNALGDMHGALDSAKKASALTNRQDPAIETLVAALVLESATAASKQKKLFAKMFA